MASDAGALIRSAGLAGAIPALGRRAREYVRAYDEVVTPIIESVVDRCSRYVGDQLCGTCVKLCFLLAAYAELAGVPFRADLAVLGGAVARIYDDLVDEPGAGAGAESLSVLFSGGRFAPSGPVERLLAALYTELERRLNRDRTDPIYRELALLHRVQLRSRDQRDATISRARLDEITEAKGAHATAVLFALVRPAMPDAELALLHRLGGVLQLVDDYVDAAVDRHAGITTAATRHEVTLGAICARLRALRSGMRTRFGREQPLYAVLYLNLWLCLLSTHCPRWLPRGTPTRLLVRAIRSRERADRRRSVGDRLMRGE